MRQLHKHPQDIECAAKILKKARFASKASLSRDLLTTTRDEYKSGELVLVVQHSNEVSQTTENINHTI